MGRRKLKLTKDTIDWDRVRRLMRASFTGRGGQSDDDFDYIQAAYKADPERYSTEGEAVRSHERKMVNPFARSDDSD